MTACWIDRPLGPGQAHPFLPPHSLFPAPAASRFARLARLGRRLTVALLGALAVLAGVAMLVLPGPGLVTIALGFGILGREYAWAARVNASLRARLAATTDTVRQAVRRP